MTLAIALQTETFELSFAFRRYGSGGDPSLWLLLLALLLSLLGLAVDFLLIGAGGWLALWPVTLALGMALAVAGWEVRRCYAA